MSARRRAAALALAALALLALRPHAAAAAGERLRGALIAAGGGTASDGAHGMRASIGQPAAGSASASSRIECAGYWCFGGTSTVSVDPPAGPGAHGIALAIGAPSPNPAPGRACFAISLPEAALVSFAAFDVAGRSVGEPVTRSLGAGRHDVWWSPEGSRPGMYFVRVAVAGEVRAERRVVVLR